MRLAVIEGDGIGREVIPAAVEVLDAFGLEFEKCLWKSASKVGKNSTAMSEEDVDTIKSCDAVLFEQSPRYLTQVIKCSPDYQERA